MLRSLLVLCALCLAFSVLLCTATEASSSPDEHLRLVLRYEDGQVQFERKMRIPAAPRRISLERIGWRVVVSDAQGNALDDRIIDDPRRLHVEWVDPADGETLQGHEVLLEQASFALTLPVPPDDAHRVTVYDTRGALLGLLQLGGEFAVPGDGANTESSDGGVDACTGGWSSTLVRDSGAPANRLNITFLGDGYTTGDLASYALDVQNTIDYLLQREPYKEYQNFINFYRVDVISNETGVDEPDNGIFKDTALDCAFNWGGTARCLYCPSAPVFDAADCVPETDEILVVGNTTRYGGCGGAFSVYAGKNASATDIAFHELGHSFASLADEYAGGGTWPAGFEHPDKNCTIYTESEMQSQQKKWYYWLDLGEVTTFDTCGIRDGSLKRPVVDCEMRSLNRTMCPICEEEHILLTHARVDLIDSSSPTGDTTINQLQSATFEIDLVPPLTHSQDVSWTIDSAPTGVTDTQFVVGGDEYSLGMYIIRAEAVDNTDKVRMDPTKVMDSERQWNLTIACDDPVDGDSDADGFCENGLGGIDCNDTDANVWTTPGEALSLFFDEDPDPVQEDGTELSWTAPTDPGGQPNSIVYDLLRSSDPTDFDGAAICVETDDGPNTVASDLATPAAGSAFFYVTRGDNSCPDPGGSIGTDSSGLPRTGRDCS